MTAAEYKSPQPTANGELTARVGRVEQDLSSLAATLNSFGDLLREVRNEQIRPKPGTNWIGIVTLALAMIGGGAVYVETQTSPIDLQLDTNKNILIMLSTYQRDLLKESATSKENRRWLEVENTRNYTNLRDIQMWIGTHSTAERDQLIDEQARLNNLLNSYRERMTK